MAHHVVINSSARKMYVKYTLLRASLMPRSALIIRHLPRYTVMKGVM